MKKSVFTTVLAAVFAVMAMTPVFAGNLNQTLAPSDPATAMYRLEDIYNRLLNGAAGAKRVGPFAEPGAGPTAGTGFTLDQIMALAPALDAAGATAGDVMTGKKFWGLTAGAWGLQTGSGVPAPVPATGDSTDGATGVNFPNPRFTVNAGTVKDNLTGLIWLKNANCANATRDWATAKTDVVSLNTAGTMNGNHCGDTSNAGSYQTDWRLPNRNELNSLIHAGYYNPALSDTVGTGQWTAGNPFDNMQSSFYWSASTYAGDPTYAWTVSLFVGGVYCDAKTSTYYVCPVR